MIQKHLVLFALCILPDATAKSQELTAQGHKTCALSACVGVRWGWKFGACMNDLRAGLRMLCAEATKDKHKTWDLKTFENILDTRIDWRKTLTTFDIWGVELSPGWAPSINLTKLESSKWQIWISFYMQKKLKPKGTCSLQFLSWRLIILDNFINCKFGGVWSSQEESDGIVSAHQFSGLLAVFGLTRWANSLWTATDILVPLKGTYPLRMRHQPECAYASKKMPLVLRFWVKMICLIHPDTVLLYAFFEVLDFPGTTCGSWNCNPGCAGHTTNACPPQWDFWALNVSGKAAWWRTNLAKHSEDNSWNIFCLDILPYPSIVHILVTSSVLVSPFSRQKNTQNVTVDHCHRLYGTAMDSMSKILPVQGPLWSSDLESLRFLAKVFEVWVWGEFSGEKKDEKPQMSQIHILKYTNSTSDPALHPLSLAPLAGAYWIWPWLDMPKHKVKSQETSMFLFV